VAAMASMREPSIAAARENEDANDIRTRQPHARG
jgi:hypothetical protein